MNQTPSKTRNQQEASDYELRVQGHLGARWAAHLDAARLVNELDGTTTLLVRVLDQAALHGLLGKIRDLGLPLLSLTPVGAQPCRQRAHRAPVAAHQPRKEPP